MAEARDSNNWSIGELCQWTKRNFDIGRSQTLVYLSVANATSRLSAPEQTEFNSMDDFRRRVLGHERVPGRPVGPSRFGLGAGDADPDL